MKLKKCIRGVKLIIILAAISLLMIISPLLGEEPNQSMTDSVEQTIEAVTELRVRAKTIKGQIEAALRETRAQHKREWEDATSSDPNEVLEAEQQFQLIRKTIWALGKVAPVIAEFRRDAEANKQLYLSLSDEGKIRSAFTESYSIQISPKGKIIWPSTVEIASRSNSEVHKMAMGLFYRLYDLESFLGDETGIFVLVHLPKHEMFSIRVLSNTVSARKNVSKGFSDKFVEVIFPYNNMKPSLERAKKDLWNARAKFKKALTEMREQQGDESREYGLMKAPVDSLDKELRRTLADLKRSEAIPQEFEDKLQKLNELVEQIETDVAKKLAITRAKYGHTTKAEGVKEDMDIEDAVNRGQLSRARRILKKDPALVNRLDGKGRTALHKAVRKDSNNAMLGLLIEEGADVNAKDGDGKTPLHWAVEERLSNAVGLLLRKGADVEAKDNWGHTALHYAAIQNHKGILEALVAKGANLNAKDKYGRTLLHWAVEEQLKDDVVGLLLRKGADVEARDNRGRTALHYVTRTGSMDVAGILITGGADMNAKDEDGKTPLHWAVEEQLSNVVDLLLRKGTDVEARDNDGHTALHYVTRTGSADVAGILITSGADVNAKGEYGRTALHMAVEEGLYGVAQVLLAKGADVNAQDKYGETVLHKAANAWWNESSKKGLGLLLRKGADVEIKNNDGYTALHCAAVTGHKGALEVLIAKGADVNAKAKYGQTPLDVVASEEQDNLAELLRRHGAISGDKDEQKE